MANTKMIIQIATVAALLACCSGSAIVMWEYLSKNEKMSHLYSMFAKQVQSYCKTSGSTMDMPTAQCKRELLVYGLGKLHDMPESHLDAMDPYQRGATDIIWDSMMEGHPSHPVKQETSTPTPIRYATGPYGQNPLFNDRPVKDRGTINGPVRRSTTVTPSASVTSKIATTTTTTTTVRPSAVAGIDPMDAYSMDMDYGYGYKGTEVGTFPTGSDSLYNEPANHLSQDGASTNLNAHYVAAPSNGYQTIVAPDQSYQQNFLSGPMVIRVRLDGTPVEEDRAKPLPYDDDRVDMTIGSDRLPTVEQLSARFREPQPMPVRSNLWNYRRTALPPMPAYKPIVRSTVRPVNGH